MSRIRKVYMLLTSAALSALTAGSATDAQAQTSSSEAYAAALAEGSNAALQRFLDRYPLAPEADDAFRRLVTATRGSSLVDSDSGTATARSVTATPRQAPSAPIPPPPTGPIAAVPTTPTNTVGPTVFPGLY